MYIFYWRFKWKILNFEIQYFNSLAAEKDAVAYSFIIKKKAINEDNINKSFFTIGLNILKFGN
jgi:hypothetical protein